MCYTQMYFGNVFVYSVPAVVVLVNSKLSHNRFLMRKQTSFDCKIKVRSAHVGLNI